MRFFEALKPRSRRRKPKNDPTDDVNPTHSAPGSSHSGDLRADDTSSVLSTKNGEAPYHAEKADFQELGKECFEAIALQAEEDWHNGNNPFLCDGLPVMDGTKQREGWLAVAKSNHDRVFCYKMVHHRLYKPDRSVKWNLVVRMKKVQRVDSGTQDGERECGVAVLEVKLWWLCGPESQLFEDSYTRVIQPPDGWNLQLMGDSDATASSALTSRHSNDELSQGGINGISTSRSLYFPEPQISTSRVTPCVSTESKDDLMKTISTCPS